MSQTDPRDRSRPTDYALHRVREGDAIVVRVYSPDGSLAANGYAAEVSGVFIYDRIVTAPEHRRKGLSNIVMNALGPGRSSPDVPKLLVATEDGRALYTTLGWRVLSPYSTAMIRPLADRVGGKSRNEGVNDPSCSGASPGSRSESGVIALSRVKRKYWNI